MKLEEIQVLEIQAMEELVKRRRLGGYSADAEGVLFILEQLYKIIHHLREQVEFPSETKDKEPKSTGLKIRRR